MLEFFRNAAQWRNATPALRTGDMRLIAAGEDVVLIERTISDGRDVFGKKAKNDKKSTAVLPWIFKKSSRFCLTDESILLFFFDVIEMDTPTGYADLEVSVLLGILLGFA